MSRRFVLYLLTGAVLVISLAFWALWFFPTAAPPKSAREHVPAEKTLVHGVAADRPAAGDSEPEHATASTSGAQDSTAGTPGASSVVPGTGPQSAVPPIVPPAPSRKGYGSNEPPKRSIADVLEDIDLSVPGAREKAVAEIQAMEEDRKLAGIARARELGLPLRTETPDGTIKEIAGLDENGEPLYFVTYNANAAISTGANLLQAAPYSLDGAGLILGVWDGGIARYTHQELAGRVSVKDGAGFSDHATHVVGTMIASGLVPAAKGMATAASVYSYDWNNDKSEMISMGAALSSDATKVFISNHSYGYLRGWNYTGNDRPAKQPPRLWEWRGTGTNATLYNAYFGLYSESARDSDAIACSAPYYLMFRAAGNDRGDNPKEGQAVFVPGYSNVVSYSQALHPPGDGVYRGGFDTIANDALAKNVVTIGSVSAAVADGVRDVSQASISSFSCWGPTDDGRIKPDLVADGEKVYSAQFGTDISYRAIDGTSMATPNASGTAALVMKEYMNLFGGAMRSSTLKGLLIHTADDLGNPGPDYKYGWGLVNGKAAVDLVRDHKNKPDKARISEKQLTTSSTSLTQDFYSDGVSPIRVTLCWTDPAGAAVTTSDLRSPRLRNDLDLKVTGPGGSQHLPYVMPFVGTWTQASMNSPAVTGINKTDNVEQVYIAVPPAPGAYRATVTFRGTLANNQQSYSLLVSSDSASTQPPPATLSLASVFPNSGFAGNASFLLRLNGVSLATANSVKLTRFGAPTITATNLSVVGQTLWCYVNLFAVPSGTWTVEVGSAGGTTTLPDAFEIKRSIYAANFDGPVTGWRSSSVLGTNSWALAPDSQQPGASAYFATAPAGKTTTLLTSPSIFIPGTAGNVQLKFRHSYNLESGRDGARLQISVDDGGTWFDTDAAGSGVAFASNDYGASMSAIGEPANLGDFSGKQAWSGNSGGFVETILNLTDNAKFAGKTVRFRWVLATDASNANASAGWSIDDVLVVDEADFANQDPSIASVTGPAETATDADGNTIRIVRDASAEFGVTATDDAGESGLVYTWSAQGPAGAPEVFFFPNGDNTAKNTMAYFEKAGDYLFTISAHDGQEFAAAKSVMVRVMAVPMQVEVDPENASVTHGGALQLTASLVDQFGDPVAEQPGSFTWLSSAGGSVSAGGLFTAGSAGGPFVVTATSGAFAGAASITANNSPFDLWCLENFGAAWESNPGDPRFAADGDADGDGCSNLAEYYLGINPGDASSRLWLKVLSVDPAQRRVILEISPVVTTGSFALQTSSSMSEGWGPEEPVYVPQADSSGVLDVPEAGASKFYRILFRPPSQ